MFCGNCGNNIQDALNNEDSFCSNCGTKIVQHILYCHYHAGRARVRMNTYLIFYNNYYLQATLLDSFIAELGMTLVNRGVISNRDAFNHKMLCYEVIPLLYELSKSDIINALAIERLEVPYSDIESVSFSYANGIPSHDTVQIDTSTPMDVHKCKLGYNRQSEKAILELIPGEDSTFVDFGFYGEHAMTQYGTTASFLYRIFGNKMVISS